MRERITLLLLFGGQSCEHEVSVTSARSLLAAIDRERYELLPVGIAKDGAWVLLERPDEVFERGFVEASAGERVFLDYTFLNSVPGDRRGGALLKSRARADYAHEIDVVFPLLHGPRGEDGTVQGLFELAGVAYVGAGVAGSAVSMDKELMRRVFKAEGLRQTRWTAFRGSAWRRDADALASRCEAAFGYPMFVKPCNLGSSVGVSKAFDGAQLRAAVDLALEYDYKAMVEESVEGAQEIECAVLGNDFPEASVLGEIVPGAEFYDYQTKYIDDKSELVIPARLNETLTRRVRELSVAAFEAVEAFGLARVDFLVQARSDRVFINEINTMPGFTPISMYPKLWRETGIPYAALIDRLVDLARERRALMEDVRIADRLKSA